MHLGVFPAIAQIAVESVKADQAAFVDEAITVWLLAVMLMDLRQTVREVELLMVDSMAEGQLYEFQLGKNFFISGRT